MANFRPARDAVTPQSEVDSPAGAAATLEAMLVGENPMLIGISGKPEDRTAIVLSRKGDILRLKRGDRLDGKDIVAITETQLQLKTRTGRVVAMALPR